MEQQMIANDGLQYVSQSIMTEDLTNLDSPEKRLSGEEESFMAVNDSALPEKNAANNVTENSCEYSILKEGFNSGTASCSAGTLPGAGETISVENSSASGNTAAAVSTFIITENESAC